MGKDIFISRSWGVDQLNRDNHLRCKQLADILISNKYKIIKAKKKYICFNLFYSNKITI